MATKRKDSKGRNLKDGEIQLSDGRYKFQYMEQRRGAKSRL